MITLLIIFVYGFNFFFRISTLWEDKLLPLLNASISILEILWKLGSNILDNEKSMIMNHLPYDFFLPEEDERKYEFLWFHGAEKIGNIFLMWPFGICLCMLTYINLIYKNGGRPCWTRETAQPLDFSLLV